MTLLDFETLQQLSRAAERIDTACPICGPHCKAGSNRARKVLRIFNPEAGFSTYVCQRCGEKGFAHERGRRSSKLDPVEEIIGILNPTVVVPEKQPDHDAEKEAKSALARRLWRRRLPIRGTIAETYLRDVRGYRGPLPDTLGFLPPNGKYKPSMIAAFGIANEPEPGVLEIDPGDITGIHMTRLLPDGSGKDNGDDHKAKIMLGPSAGQPIVLARAMICSRWLSPKVSRTRSRRTQSLDAAHGRREVPADYRNWPTSFLLMSSASPFSSTTTTQEVTMQNNS
jgi:hypothetical protein